MANEDGYIQVGMTAMRNPVTGEFLQPVPLFIRADDRAQAGEQKLIDDIGKLLAQRYKRYVDACKAEGLTI